ncbi:hypothetical protein LZK73_21930 [Neorhizobium galegae]|nr:hypothetical protein LZK73_21930 [Neorhizobium galegae]
MRTFYYGDTIRHNADHKRTSRIHHKTVEMEREPQGDDMPVFDRRASGGRGEYERPYRAEEDGVWISRGRRY